MKIILKYSIVKKHVQNDLKLHPQTFYYPDFTFLQGFI